MYATRIAAALAFCLVGPAGSVAADIPPGATSCTGCHAARTGTDSSIPSLSGRDAGEIMAAMVEFRAGKRPATVMDRIAKGFSDAELRPIAAWLSQQR
jgi:cytochrome c553